MTTRFKILVLGGTGIFGGRICQRLSRAANLQVIVAGRSRSKIDACLAHLHRMNAAVLLARKIANRELAETGAMPCLNMITVEEFTTEVSDLSIEMGVAVTDGHHRKRSRNAAYSAASSAT